MPVKAAPVAAAKPAAKPAAAKPAAPAAKPAAPAAAKPAAPAAKPAAKPAAAAGAKAPLKTAPATKAPSKAGTAGASKEKVTLAAKPDPKETVSEVSAKLDELDMSKPAAANPLANCTPDSKIWKIGMPALPGAILLAQKAGKTPLLLDGNDNKTVDVFFTYQAGAILDAKKLMVEESVLKTKTLEETHEELRTRLISAIKLGHTLYISMGNSATMFTTKYCKEGKFPVEVFETEAWDSAASANPGRAKICCRSKVNCKAMRESLATGKQEKDDLEFSDASGRGDSFDVIVSSHFQDEDYADFLAGSLPLDKMQAISVVVD